MTRGTPYGMIAGVLFDEIVYQFKLRKLRELQRAVSASFGRKVKEAREQPDPHDKLHKIWRDEDEEYSLFEEEIRQLQTRHLIRTAHDLFLPNELQMADWEEGR